MTTVFLHGAPVTPVVWQPLIACLPSVRAITPRIPGFGTPLPNDFEATMQRYADWFAAELSEIDGPVDLVAQDWGALISLPVLADRPANLRSWVLDAADLQADFEWHGSAKLMQSSDGDAMIEAVVSAAPDKRLEMMLATGIHESIAEEIAREFNDAMGSTLLSLYRSAINIGSEWGPLIDQIRPPGIVVDARQDPFRAVGSAERFAARTGSTLVTRKDSGHWWMLDDPQGMAELLIDFWASL